MVTSEARTAVHSVDGPLFYGWAEPKTMNKTITECDGDSQAKGYHSMNEDLVADMKKII